MDTCLLPCFTSARKDNAKDGNVLILRGYTQQLEAHSNTVAIMAAANSLAPLWESSTEKCYLVPLEEERGETRDPQIFLMLTRKLLK